MQKEEEKSLEKLEKIYLKDKFPRAVDTDFNRLDIKAKDLKQAAEAIELSKLKESEKSEDYESYEFIKPEDSTMAANYESLSLINGARLGDSDNTEVENIKEEDLVSDRYSTPLRKVKAKMIFLKYGSLLLSLFVVVYLAYHMVNLFKWKILYNEENQEGKKLNEYYQKNSDNMIFGSTYLTMVLYFLGISLNIYNILVHYQAVRKNLKFYENDYLVNHQIQENCKKARILVLAFAVVFCVGNIFQIAKSNYSRDFDDLANEKSNEENNNNEEDPSIVASMKVYFYVLVITAVLIKIGLCFVNAFVWEWLMKIKFEYSRMVFDLKNNVNL